jgi:D-glycero-D-manno-heptose 1,7-bisphosphate phosphatase
MVQRRAVGLHVERLTTSSAVGLPALFLDRDGVLVVDSGYLHRPEDVVLVAGTAEAVAAVNRAGIPVILVTNQAGIGRGYYGWDDFDAVQRQLIDRLAEEDAHVDLVLACACHAEGRGPYAAAEHPWRKPRPGMFLEAGRMLELDLTRSFVVGDQVSDLQAGAAAGLREGALVQGGGDPTAEGPAWLREGATAAGFTVTTTECPACVIRDWLVTVARQVGGCE